MIRLPRPVIACLALLAACADPEQRTESETEGAAIGRTYYVAPGGSNSNPGTQAAPFATLQKAHDVAT
ncbi:MAG: right-handed parallel beta-helix repeat-containing protein, partial [Steroidobacteraceae bacterium]